MPDCVCHGRRQWPDDLQLNMTEIGDGFVTAAASRQLGDVFSVAGCQCSLVDLYVTRVVISLPCRTNGTEGISVATILCETRADTTGSAAACLAGMYWLGRDRRERSFPRSCATVAEIQPIRTPGGGHGVKERQEWVRSVIGRAAGRKRPCLPYTGR